MRKTSKFLMLLFAAVATSFCFTACDDTEDGSYVPPITLGEKIAGQWQLSSITQIDESNAKTMDLTEQFDFATLGLSLNGDGTYTVSGSAPAFIPASGTWRMANDFVNSDGTAAQIIMNDNLFLTVTGVPTGGTSHLKFKLTRKAKGIAFVSYEYDLIKVSNDQTEETEPTEPTE